MWLGVGKVLVTRGQRNAATPVIVRKGAAWCGGVGEWVRQPVGGWVQGVKQARGLRPAFRHP
jgi:hypothetical protein